MELKSWHIAISGICVQTIVVAAILGGVASTGQVAPMNAASMYTIFLVFTFATASLAVLLARKKTRVMGGILSVVLGVSTLPIPALRYIAVFPLAAGVYALWQKQ